MDLNYTSPVQIGEGTYGKVYRAHCVKRNITCAIKRIQIDPKNGFPFTTIREIRILKKLSHSNLVSLLDVSIHNDEMFISMDYHPFDLSGILQVMKLNDNQIFSLTYQLIDAVNYIHSFGLVHRDIKSSNILLNRDGTLKLADFGLTRKVDLMMTNRVCTLWYRPPELLLGSTDYGLKVDSWSIGCVIIEMKTGKIAFKGTDEIDQVNVVLSKLGAPKEKYQWSEMFNIERYNKNKAWSAVLTDAFGDVICKDMLNLVGEFIRLNPRERMAPGNALKFEVLREFKDLRLGINVNDIHNFYCKERKKKNNGTIFD